MIRLLKDDNNEEQHQENSLLGTVLIPLSFALICFILICVLPIIERYKDRRTHQTNDGVSSNLSEKEFEDSVVIKVRKKTTWY